MWGAVKNWQVGGGSDGGGRLVCAGVLVTEKRSGKNFKTQGQGPLNESDVRMGREVRTGLQLCRAVEQSSE